MSTMKGYMAVYCADNPDHVILLRLVDSERALEAVYVAPFEVACPVCKTTRRYDGSLVKVILGPPPNETFQTHPSFRWE